MKEVDEFDGCVSDEKQVVASLFEEYLDEKVAPFVTQSRLGKLSIISCYLILIGVSIHGFLQTKTYYSNELLITEDYPSYEFKETKKRLFPETTGYHTVTAIKFEDEDYHSEQAQLLQYNFIEAMTRCESCEERWHLPQTLDSSFYELRKWIDQLVCPHLPQGIDPFKKTVDPENFAKCEQIWSQTTYLGNVYTLSEFYSFDRIRIRATPIEDQGRDGPTYLRDIKIIDSQSGFLKVQSLDFNFYYQTGLYELLEKDTATTVCLSLLIVFVSVFILTLNIWVTLLVIFSVLLVDLFMMAAVHYWGLTFNFLIALNLCFALGITVDYSAHIAHTFLRIESGRSDYKARKAISRMGPSVLNAGISTTLAISVLAFAKGFTFDVFFKTWITFLLFGLANSILLLPVLLSFVSTSSSD